jgi:hypothetical protein
MIRKHADIEIDVVAQRLVVDLVGPPADGSERSQVPEAAVPLIARRTAEVRGHRFRIERHGQEWCGERLLFSRIRDAGADEVGLRLLDPGRGRGRSAPSEQHGRKRSGQLSHLACRDQLDFDQCAGQWQSYDLNVVRAGRFFCASVPKCRR